MNQSNWKQQIAAKMSAGGTLTYDELEAALAFAMQERATFRAMLAAAPALAITQEVQQPDAANLADAKRYRFIKRFAFHRTTNGFDGTVLMWNLHIPASEQQHDCMDAAVDEQIHFHGIVPKKIESDSAAPKGDA
jgi:hypothetical protein